MSPWRRLETIGNDFKKRTNDGLVWKRRVRHLSILKPVVYLLHTKLCLHVFTDNKNLLSVSALKAVEASLGDT